jgi:hypothetical protein
MEEDIIAVVIKVEKRSDLGESPEKPMAIHKVFAKIDEPNQKFLSELFWVKIIKPVELSVGQREPGALMAHGEFMFETIDEVKVGDQLHLSVASTSSEAT